MISLHSPLCPAKAFSAPVTLILLKINCSTVHGNFFTFILGLGLKYAAKNYIKNKIIQTVVTYVALSMITQGVNNILSPQQNTQQQNSREDPLDPSALASNYSFTGLTNISQAGIPVNLAYGEILVGSIVVSNGIDTVQVEGTN